MNFYKNMAFLFILLLSGCYPDQEESTETIVKPARKTIIASANVVINVTDETGQTLTGLTARFNKQSKIINQASFFQFDAKNIYKENELLTFTDKDGQVYEYDLYNIENQVNYHNLALFRNTIKKAFSASEGTTINYPSGNLNIDLTSSTFTTGNETYAGNVTCLYNEFDINNLHHIQAIPGGNLIDIEGKYSIIDWVHVFRFDLLTQSEKYLSLTQPKNVTLNVTPDNYHIIHYDRTKKIWVYQRDFLDNQSIAIQHSGMYAVVRLSEPAVINGTFFANNLPMVRQPIVYVYNGKKHHSLTTNTGKWEIQVPKNKEITIYPEHECAGQNFGFTAMASSELLSTGIKNLTIPELRQITLKGSFKDCQAKDLQAGFITFQNGTVTENYYIPETHFDWKIPVCVHGPLSFGATGTNGETMSHIGFQSDVADLGNVYLCSGLENQYISIQTPEGNIIYTGNISVSDANGEYQIHFKSTSQEFFLKFKNNEQSGQLQTTDGNIVWKDIGFLDKGIEINCPTSNTCGFEEIEVLSYQKNGWIKGSFKGKFWSKTLTPLTAKNQNMEVDFFIKL